MAEDWNADDPFSDPADPAAAERERRRLEREERRQHRETGAEEADSSAKGSRRRWGRRSGPDAQAEPTPEPAAAPEPKPKLPPAAGAADQEASSRPAAAEPNPDSIPPRAQRTPVVPPPPPERDQESEPPRVEPALPLTPDEEFWDEPAHAAAREPDEYAFAKPRPTTPSGKTPSRGGFLGALRRHPFRVVAAIAAVVVIWFLFALFQPFHGAGSGQVVVSIPKGASVSEVGDLLDRSGVIDSSTLFQLRVTLEGKRSDLFPGQYTLAHGMSYSAAIDALSKPPVKKVTTVTIPEGYSRTQAAALAKEDGLTGNYMKETVHSRYLNPAKYGGKDAKNLEGFLFPDTFDLKPGAPVANLVQLQLEDFKRRIKGVNMSYAKSKNLTVFDVVTIASMVEREAQLEKERPLIAAVIYNRLHEGMPLGIDATTRFAVGNYDKPLTESQLATDSPYNTRTHQGLPPGPIASPGLASIEAAAHPAKVGYLYYVVKPGTCGEDSFAKTEAEFDADVERYNSAREAAGGNSPTTCGQ